MEVERTGIVLKPNYTRVVFRPFEPPSDERKLKIIGRVMALGEDEVQGLLSQVLRDFVGRHTRIMQFFAARFERVKSYLLTDAKLSQARQLLIGAYFTLEYSLESAALFNPSMVWHPDQSNLPPGSRRFVVSLRATGEGHISSITFRSGVVDADCRLWIDEPTRYVTPPDPVPDSLYEKPLFLRKLAELGIENGIVDRVMPLLADPFTLKELQHVVGLARRTKGDDKGAELAAAGLIALAKSNYEVQFTPEQSLSERVIFPSSPAETNGIEDARFVQFTDDNGEMIYYATYTAYDGKVILPQMLATRDFLHFKISTLNGPEVRNKGFALFPRKINGKYAMLSRQDNENIFVMTSDMLHFWYTKELIAKPTYPWEFVQLGNCGSPIETEAGWLVLTHGVGPMRRYAMGAFLLDINDPTRVIGRLPEPLLAPNEEEREGYVPNVVYSCGGLVHQGTLIIPYAMSDYASSFATVPLMDVLNAMERG